MREMQWLLSSVVEDLHWKTLKPLLHGWESSAKARPRYVPVEPPGMWEGEGCILHVQPPLMIRGGGF